MNTPRSTLGRFAALVLLVALGSAFLAAPATADYPAAVETQCSLKVEKAGDKPKDGYDAILTVTSAAGVPDGSAEIGLSGETSTTAPLVNGEARVHLPKVKPNKTYTVDGSYLPTEGSQYKSCSASASFTASRGADASPKIRPASASSDNNEDLGFLLAALAMLAVGSASFYLGRRKDA